MFSAIRRRWREIALLGVTLVLVLVLVEVVVRRYVPPPAPYLEPQVLPQSSPTIGWEMKPAQRSYTVNAVATIDSRGARGPERPLAKTPGTFRVVAIGDSITFGMGVRDNETYSARLEQVLGAQMGRQVEVVNLGVAGYNLRQYLIVLKEKALQYEPDLIVLGICWNDVVGNERPLPWEPGFVRGRTAADDTAWIVGARRHLLPKVIRDPLRDWRTLYFTVQRIKMLKEVVSPSQHPYWVFYRALLNRDKAFLAPSWNVMEKRFLEFTEVARGHRIPMVVAIFPDGAQMLPAYRDIEYPARITSFAGKASVPVVDLLPPFLGVADKTWPLLASNSHPNAVGHDIAARELSRLITSSGVVARR